MGIESIVYRFELQECGIKEFSEWLRLSGASSGGRPGAYVLSGADYWLDLLVQAKGSVISVVRLRVAFTNPVSVVPLLNEVMSELMTCFGGRVTDAAARRVIGDTERLAVLMAEFADGRERFTQNFGDIVLPVSADQVFARLREEFEGPVGQ